MHDNNNTLISEEVKDSNLHFIVISILLRNSIDN